MTIPTNRMSYIDCFEVWDRALEDPKGIRVPFETREAAKHFQMRMHNARAVDRRENRSIYEKGHQMHGQSTYDPYQVIIREGEDGTYFLYLEPRDKHIAIDQIESLSELEAEDVEDEKA